MAASQPPTANSAGSTYHGGVAISRLNMPSGTGSMPSKVLAISWLNSGNTSTPASCGRAYKTAVSPIQAKVAIVRPGRLFCQAKRPASQPVSRAGSASSHRQWMADVSTMLKPLNPARRSSMACGDCQPPFHNMVSAP